MELSSDVVSSEPGMEVRGVHPIEYRLRRKLADWLCPERVQRREFEADKAELLCRETRVLLHELWGKASSDTYVKSQWGRFQYLIETAAELRVTLAREGVVEIPSRMLDPW